MAREKIYLGAKSRNDQSSLTLISFKINLKEGSDTRVWKCDCVRAKVYVWIPFIQSLAPCGTALAPACSPTLRPRERQDEVVVCASLRQKEKERGKVRRRLSKRTSKFVSEQKGRKRARAKEKNVWERNRVRRGRVSAQRKPSHNTPYIRTALCSVLHFVQTWNQNVTRRTSEHWGDTWETPPPAVGMWEERENGIVCTRVKEWN